METTFMSGETSRNEDQPPNPASDFKVWRAGVAAAGGCHALTSFSAFERETFVAARERVQVEHTSLSASSKGLARSLSVSNNLPRKGGKLRKNEDGGKKPVAVSDFVSGRRSCSPRILLGNYVVCNGRVLVLFCNKAFSGLIIKLLIEAELSM
ncbi:hypothetical protein V6N13_074684 [Hibiscus sabdariffa]|uniref:Uncharacterized protein n=1 Tax=Hibiscus sabdariffa TaxID=183260 RepID=A0ABR2U9F2_9ROSI